MMRRVKVDCKRFKEEYDSNKEDHNYIRRACDKVEDTWSTQTIDCTSKSDRVGEIAINKHGDKDSSHRNEDKEVSTCKERCDIDTRSKPKRKHCTSTNKDHKLESRSIKRNSRMGGNRNTTNRSTRNRRYLNCCEWSEGERSSGEKHTSREEHCNVTPIPHNLHMTTGGMLSDKLRQHKARETNCKSEMQGATNVRESPKPIWQDDRGRHLCDHVRWTSFKKYQPYVEELQSPVTDTAAPETRCNREELLSPVTDAAAPETKCSREEEMKNDRVGEIANNKHGDKDSSQRNENKKVSTCKERCDIDTRGERSSGEKQTSRGEHCNVTPTPHNLHNGLVNQVRFLTYTTNHNGNELV